MSKYDFNQLITWIVWIAITAFVIKGCASYDFAGAILGPDRATQIGD